MTTPVSLPVTPALDALGAVNPSQHRVPNHPENRGRPEVTRVKVHPVTAAIADDVTNQRNSLVATLTQPVKVIT